MQLSTGLSLYLISFQTEEVDLLKVKQLSLLEIGQFASLCVQLESLPHGHRVLNFFLCSWVSRNLYLFGRLLLLVNICVLSMLAEPLRRLLLTQVSTFEQRIRRLDILFLIFWTFLFLDWIHGRAGVL